MYAKVKQEDSWQTPKDDSGISNANLKSIILFGQLRIQLSEHNFE